MYGYSEGLQPADLSIQELFELIPQEEIFQIFIKEPIIVDDGETKYTAPYREDTNPGCYFQYNNDELRFIDFASGDNYNSENAVGFISKCLNLSFTDSKTYIYNYFKLNSMSTFNLRKKRAEDHSKIYKFKPFAHDDTISYAIRKWDLRDKKFWFDRYNITREQLIFDKVHPIFCYRFKGKKTNEPYTITTFDIAYVLSDFKSGKVKVYRPYNKEYKWFTNCNQNDVGGITHLADRNNQIIITKSYKDYRVLTNIGLKSLWFQNEGMIPSNEIINTISKKTDKIVIWFDNDQTGQTAIKRVAEKFKEYHKNVHSIFLPPILLKEDIKDPSDLIYKKNIDELKNFCSFRKILE